MSIIVFDLDGTIADCSHRVQHAQEGNWEAFHEGLMGDKVYPTVVQFANILTELNGNAALVILTGRPEKYRTQTEAWIKQNNLFGCFDQIVMRPDGNYEKDFDFKLAAVKEIEIAWGRKVELILEDRDRNVEHLRNAGYTVWQTRAGDY